tara:strand:- start:8064 stop:9053 length:990 start_codon:yes stop_codon:yes gene_type:complete
MCGLIGYTGKENADATALAIIMLANDKRGGHSTGYYASKHLEKCIGNSGGLFEIIKEVESNLFIGHTRFKTHGEVSTKNQHPFKYDNIVGAHNGVVHNYKSVGERYNIDETEVDSQMIFKVLNATGGDAKTLGLFNNTLATLYTDESTGLLHAYRKGNPLWAGRLNGGLYFSSLQEPLTYIGCSDIFQLKEGRVYTYQDAECIDKQDIVHKPIGGTHSVFKNWEDYRTPSKPKTRYVGNKHYGLSARKSAAKKVSFQVHKPAVEESDIHPVSIDSQKVSNFVDRIDDFITDHEYYLLGTDVLLLEGIKDYLEELLPVDVNQQLFDFDDF